MLRATALAIALVGVVAGLTVYFSTETIPPCLITGVPHWRAPTDGSEHHFEIVVPDRALCFVDIDHGNAFVGYVKLPGIRGVTAVAPRSSELALRYDDGRGALVDVTNGHVRTGVAPPPAPSDVLTVRANAVYSTRPGRFGLEVRDARTSREQLVTFPGFTWNPSFGPNPPDHGLSLAPDRPELWVLDAPNSTVHLFDVSAATPRRIADIRLTKPISGDENPCATHSCGRIGSLQHSNDGRYVYVGDAGDVIDTTKREEVTNLEALHQSRVTIEVDWSGGRPTFARTR